MSKDWKLVNLGEVLELSIDAVEVEPSKSYAIAGVYSFGRGLFSRSPLWGTETTYKVFHRLHKNSFVLSQLKAWEGALAIVKESFDGWFLSPQFPTFRAIPNRLDINYLVWYCKQSKVWEQLRNKSRGMGARRDSVSPKQFLSLKIPLPPLEEQRRIVAKIEELAEKIEEARSLREQTIKETKSFVTSLHLSLSGSRKIKLHEILYLDEHKEIIEFGKEYPQVGVKGFGGGLFAKESVNATQTTYKAFNRLYEGAIVLSQVKGWEGAISVCSSKLADKYVSPEYRTFSCIPEQAIPEYLSILFAAPWFWTKLKNLTRGMGGRRERTRPEQFLEMVLPMPTVDQQKQALLILKKIKPMQRLREKTLQELDALLPSILDKAFKGEL